MECYLIAKLKEIFEKMHIFSYTDFCRHPNVTQSLKYCIEANFAPNSMIYSSNER